jgi:hypothetical protein
VPGVGNQIKEDNDYDSDTDEDDGFGTVGDMTVSAA